MAVDLSSRNIVQYTTPPMATKANRAPRTSRVVLPRRWWKVRRRKEAFIGRLRRELCWRSTSANPRQGLAHRLVSRWLVSNRQEVGIRKQNGDSRAAPHLT